MRIVGIITLIVASATLLLTYCSHREQDKRWTELNRPWFIVERGGGSSSDSKEFNRRISLVNRGQVPAVRVAFSVHPDTDKIEILEINPAAIDRIDPGPRKGAPVDIKMIYKGERRPQGWNLNIHVRYQNFEGNKYEEELEYSE